MMVPIVILGAGGHTKVLVETLLASSAVIAGIVDSDLTLVGTTVLGVPVLGGDHIVDCFPPSEVRLVNGLGSIGKPAKRKQIYEAFVAKGYSFATTIHPSAVVASDVQIGEGVQIMAGAVIQPSCAVGSNSIINTKASLDHDCIVGDHSHVAPGVTISGGVRIGESVHIGTGSTIIQGITLGAHSVIGAGAVVVKNVVAGTLVYGVPAKERTI